MGKMNIGRILLGGLVAGIVLFLGDGMIHGMVLKQGWVDVMAALGKKVVEGDQGKGFPMFLLYDVSKGVAAVFIYAAIRPRFGAGAKTAVIAGLTAWVLVIPIALIGLVPMELFPIGFIVTWSIAGAVVMALGAVAGSALYKEAA